MLRHNRPGATTGARRRNEKGGESQAGVKVAPRAKYGRRRKTAKGALKAPNRRELGALREKKIERIESRVLCLFFGKKLIGFHSAAVFNVQKSPFYGDPLRIAHERAVLAYEAMAWHYYGYGIVVRGLGDGPAGFRVA